ncbi:hypothetical protein MNB_SV-4-1343 [hydrothermal vent metagenome]|uniref:Uncharacterized protein n=1 Tax=hydrothermal vent metagenome TaxID=652676 RepID=A0A1W1E961_9ZZZZ
MSKGEPVILTQFIREKRWIPANREEALKIIADEMPETDPEGTLAYLLSEVKRVSQVTLGECRFKALQTS